MFCRRKRCVKGLLAMLKIGDFSKLAGVSVKTLRHYDALGLLRPAQVSGENGYRFYGQEQLCILNRILALKDAGFSLEEIKGMLQAPLPKEALLGLLQSKLRQAEQDLLHAQEAVAGLQQRIRHILSEEAYEMVDITIKTVEPVLVASIRTQGLEPDDVAGFYGVIGTDIAKHGVKEIAPIMVLRHDGVCIDGVWDWQTHDWEAVLQIDREYTPDHPDIRVYQLPAVERMACMVFRGSWGEPIRLATEQMLKQMRDGGLRYTHPFREIFHYQKEGEDWSTFVTEVQYPLTE